MEEISKKSPVSVRFGLAVRARRESLGMTLADLSEHVGIQLAGVSKVERAESKPSLELAAKIACALDTTIDALLAEPQPAT